MKYKTFTKMLDKMMLLCIIVLMATVFFLAEKNSTLTAQLETIEPELPTGYMKD